MPLWPLRRPEAPLLTGLCLLRGQVFPMYMGSVSKKDEIKWVFSFTTGSVVFFFSFAHVYGLTDTHCLERQMRFSSSSS